LTNLLWLKIRLAHFRFDHDAGDAKPRDLRRCQGFEFRMSTTTVIRPEVPNTVQRRFIRLFLRMLAVVCVLALLGVSGWIGFRTWPRQLRLSTKPLPSMRFETGRMVVPLPTEVLLGEVGRFDNELSAYLWFDYLRGRPGVDASQLLLVVTEEQDEAPLYRIRIVLPNDALTAIPYLADLEAKGFIHGFELQFSSAAPVAYSRKQTDVFIAAYKRPVADTLEKLTTQQLLSRISRFVSFKSRTDPRVRAASGLEIVALGQQEATDLAADIIAVAKFYDLPLDAFLGIGAMENNYLSIRGDITHSIWKRKAAKDDIILKRRRRRVLVSNYSVGVWQITRETLRYAHALYLKDKNKRDYAEFPERLVPPDTLELDVTDPHVLTTYAGVLLRDLLDQFGGDVEKAVGAYNGGPRNPNPQYAAGVQMVASYARNVLERVSAVNERSAKADLAGSSQP